MAAMVGDVLKASHMLQMVELMKMCEGFQRRAAAGVVVAQLQQVECKERTQETVSHMASVVERTQETGAVSHMASVVERTQETGAVSHMTSVMATTAATLSPPVERQDSKDVPPVKQSDTVSAVIDRLMQFDPDDSPGSGQGFGGGENPHNIPVFPSASPVNEDSVAKAAAQAVAYMTSNPVTDVRQQGFPQNSDIATTGDTGGSKDAAKNATAAVGTYKDNVGLTVDYTAILWYYLRHSKGAFRLVVATQRTEVLDTSEFYISIWSTLEFR